MDSQYLRKSYFDNDETDLQRQMKIFAEDHEGAEDEMQIGDKLKEENYYKYHENVSHFDPRGQPYSYFYITVMGQIQFGEFSADLDGLQPHYNFVAGEDWGLVEGGQTAGVG